MTDEAVAGLDAVAQKQLFQHLLRMKQNLAAVEPRTHAATEQPTRTKSHAGRKPPRLQGTR
jgi:hypothetical protein